MRVGGTLEAVDQISKERVYWNDAKLDHVMSGIGSFLQ